MVARAILATLRHVWLTLEPTNCPRALMGGPSLPLWKQVRSTRDVDLLIGLEHTTPDAVVAVLRQAGIRTRHNPPVLDLDLMASRRCHTAPLAKSPGGNRVDPRAEVPEPRPHGFKFCNLRGDGRVRAQQ